MKKFVLFMMLMIGTSTVFANENQCEQLSRPVVSRWVDAKIVEEIRGRYDSTAFNFWLVPVVGVMHLITTDPSYGYFPDSAMHYEEDSIIEERAEYKRLKELCARRIYKKYHDSIIFEDEQFFVSNKYFCGKPLRTKVKTGYQYSIAIMQGKPLFRKDSVTCQ